MQATFDNWEYIVRNAYKTSVMNFLAMLEVLYDYYRGTLQEGQGDVIEDFKNFINTIVLDEVLNEVDGDKKIWDMFEERRY